MTSMAAALAASLPVAPTPQQRAATPQPVQPAKVPQRMEGVVDPDASRDVETVNLSSLVFLKMLKHATDILPAPPTNIQSDRNAPPTTALSSHVDAHGVLLGLDLEGVMEVEDAFALPGGDLSFGPSSYSAKLIEHLRGVASPDSPVGVYLSTHNGGFVTRTTIDLLIAVEKISGRGKAVLVVHDASRANGGELAVKGWRLSDGAREAAKRAKWDSQSLAEHRITASTLLHPLPLTLQTSPLLTAFLASLSTPTPIPDPTPSSSSSSSSFSGSSASRSLRSPNTPLPKTFDALTNPLPHSLPAYLGNTLDALTLHSHEANNVAFLVRQQARDKAKHDATVKEREEENLRRRKQGLGELPAISAEMRGGTKDPNRLELLCLQGQVEGLAKGMAGEAGKGLVRCYL